MARHSNVLEDLHDDPPQFTPHIPDSITEVDAQSARKPDPARKRGPRAVLFPAPFFPPGSPLPAARKGEEEKALRAPRRDDAIVNDEEEK